MMPVNSSIEEVTTATPDLRIGVASGEAEVEAAPVSQAEAAPEHIDSSFLGCGDDRLRGSSELPMPSQPTVPTQGSISMAVGSSAQAPFLGQFLTTPPIRSELTKVIQARQTNFDVIVREPIAVVPQPKKDLERDVIVEQDLNVEVAKARKGHFVVPTANVQRGAGWLQPRERYEPRGTWARPCNENVDAKLSPLLIFSRNNSSCVPRMISAASEAIIDNSRQQFCNVTLSRSLSQFGLAHCYSRDKILSQQKEIMKLAPAVARKFLCNATALVLLHLQRSRTALQNFTESSLWVSATGPIFDSKTDIGYKSRAPWNQAGVISQSNRAKGYSMGWVKKDDLVLAAELQLSFMSKVSVSIMEQAANSIRRFEAHLLRPGIIDPTTRMVLECSQMLTQIYQILGVLIRPAVVVAVLDNNMEDAEREIQGLSDATSERELIVGVTERKDNFMELSAEVLAPLFRLLAFCSTVAERMFIRQHLKIFGHEDGNERKEGVVGNCRWPFGGRKWIIDAVTGIPTADPVVLPFPEEGADDSPHKWGLQEWSVLASSFNEVSIDDCIERAQLLLEINPSTTKPEGAEGTWPPEVVEGFWKWSTRHRLEHETALLKGFVFLGERRTGQHRMLRYPVVQYVMNLFQDALSHFVDQFGAPPPSESARKEVNIRMFGSSVTGLLMESVYSDYDINLEVVDAPVFLKWAGACMAFVKESVAAADEAIESGVEDVYKSFPAANQRPSVSDRKRNFVGHLLKNHKSETAKTGLENWRLGPATVHAPAVHCKTPHGQAMGEGCRCGYPRCACRCSKSCCGGVDDRLVPTPDCKCLLFLIVMLYLEECANRVQRRHWGPVDAQRAAEIGMEECAMSPPGKGLLKVAVGDTDHISRLLMKLNSNKYTSSPEIKSCVNWAPEVPTMFSTEQVGAAVTGDFPQAERCIVTNLIKVARVPVMKLQIQTTNGPLMVDLTVEASCGYYNSKLIRFYCQMHPVVATLMLIVKYWAAQRQLRGGAVGKLNSYGWCILVVHFFMNAHYYGDGNQVLGPMLPSVERLKKSDIGIRCRRVSVDVRKVQRYRSMSAHEQEEVFVKGGDISVVDISDEDFRRAQTIHKTMYPYAWASGSTDQDETETPQRSVDSQDHQLNPGLQIMTAIGAKSKSSSASDEVASEVNPSADIGGLTHSAVALDLCLTLFFRFYALLFSASPDNTKLTISIRHEIPEALEVRRRLVELNGTGDAPLPEEAVTIDWLREHQAGKFAPLSKSMLPWTLNTWSWMRNDGWLLRRVAGRRSFRDGHRALWRVKIEDPFEHFDSERGRDVGSVVRNWSELCYELERAFLVLRFSNPEDIVSWLTCDPGKDAAYQTMYCDMLSLKQGQELWDTRMTAIDSLLGKLGRKVRAVPSSYISPEKARHADPFIPSEAVLGPVTEMGVSEEELIT